MNSFRLSLSGDFSLLYAFFPDLATQHPKIKYPLQRLAEEITQAAFCSIGIVITYTVLHIN